MIQIVHPGSRILGSKRHRIPDLGSATLVEMKTEASVMWCL
jgi:hypothetical protein